MATRSNIDELAALFLELATAGTDGAALVGKRTIHELLTANGPVPFTRSDGYQTVFLATNEQPQGWKCDPPLPDYVNQPQPPPSQVPPPRGRYSG